MNDPRARPPEVLGTEEIFRGRIFRVVRDRLRTAEGKTFEQELVLHPGAAVILSIPEPGRLLLVRQYRHAARDFLWEVPAGRLEPGESPERAAARELLEETGRAAARWRSLGSFYPAPGMSSERMHVFLAEGLTETAGARPDEDEEIEVGIFPMEEVRRRIRGGEIRDGKTIVALSLLDSAGPARENPPLR